MSRLDRLRAMLEADPADAFVLYALGQEYAAGGRHEEAVAHFEKCLAADPGTLYAYYHKARAQEALGNRDGALATLRQGAQAAREAGDAKALGEITALADEWSP
ncbi:MAG TPA: tetratricopeptide repeat protein [Phycisphaerales bacterium]|nr:tetratricopeptide repeat protein [Phycisphaerales bacterium]